MELETSVIALVMSRQSEPGLKEYLDWMCEELLCRELETVKVSYWDREVHGLSDVFVLLVWTPLALESFAATEELGNRSGTLSWLQQNILSNNVINLYTHNTASPTLPNWAVYFRNFYLPMHTSTASLGAYLKQEPSPKLNSKSRVDWRLSEQQARDLLGSVELVELEDLHRLLPEANKGSDKGIRVADDYTFRESKTLLWYMLNIGYFKADTAVQDFSDAIKQYSSDSIAHKGEDVRGEPMSLDNSKHPSVRILEQPKSQGYRFRYECEGHTHGGIPGENSERSRKTHPTLLFNGYDGRVVVVGYLVGDEGRYQHANSLVGRDVHRGIMVRYGVVSASSPKLELSNISIQHCKKKLIAQSTEMQLEMRRLVEKIGVDALRSALSSGSVNGSGGEAALEELTKEQLTEEDYKEIRRGQERSAASQQNLSAVKLSLIVYTQQRDSDRFWELGRLSTHSIFDSQSVLSSSPRICKANLNIGCPEGGEEIMILCEKIQKADIEVIFSDERNSEDSETGWYQAIEITSNDVHHQYAVNVKTPSYIDVDIKAVQTVYIRLRRMSDHTYSNAIEFSYDPGLRVIDPEGISRKRKKEESLEHMSRI